MYLVWMIGMFNDNSCDKEVVESNEQNAKEIKVAFIFVNNLIMFFMICVFCHKGIHFVLICFKSMLHLFLSGLHIIMFFMIYVFCYRGIHFVLICFKGMLHLFVCVLYNNPGIL